MHAYIAVRGAKMWVDQFITELQGKYLPFKYPNLKTGVLEACTLQLGVRPIQLYELGFPAEQRDIVLASVLSNKDGSNNNKNFMNGAIAMIRKIIGLKPIPEFNANFKFPVCAQNLEVVGIGMKDDYWEDSRTKERFDHKANEFCFEGV